MNRPNSQVIGAEASQQPLRHIELLTDYRDTQILFRLEPEQIVEPHHDVLVAALRSARGLRVTRQALYCCVNQLLLQAACGLGVNERLRLAGRRPDRSGMQFAQSPASAERRTPTAYSRRDVERNPGHRASVSDEFVDW